MQLCPYRKIYPSLYWDFIDTDEEKAIEYKKRGEFLVILLELFHDFYSGKIDEINFNEFDDSKVEYSIKTFFDDLISGKTI